MNILIASIARAGGVEVPADKLPFSRNIEPAPATPELRAPGLLRSALGHLFRGIGRGSSALGEKLLAAPAGGHWRAAGCG